MTFDDIKEMQIGSKKVKEAWLNGRQVYPSEKRIMDSLICWYDIGKQQCTNESMAANPVLADLSGNGHDITCYNFAWAGMSGIGGYVTDFTSFWSVYSNAQYTRNQTIINVTHIAPNNEDFIVGWLSEYTAHSVTSGTEFSLPPVRFKVTGIADLQLIAQVRGDEQAYTQDISEGVEYYFPGGNFTCARNTNVGFAIKYKSGTQPTGQEIDLNLVVEILPEYPNALVSDGVDDYTEAIQVFPKDEGTSIAVIQQLEGNRSTALLMPSDKEGLSNIWYNGLFVGGNNLLGIGFYNGTGRQTIVYYAEGEIYEKNTSVFTWNNTVTKVVVIWLL